MLHETTVIHSARKNSPEEHYSLKYQRTLQSNCWLYQGGFLDQETSTGPKPICYSTVIYNYKSKSVNKLF